MTQIFKTKLIGLKIKWMVADAAREVGISQSELSDAVHAMKDDWYNGDFSYSELLKIARDIKNGR